MKLAAFCFVSALLFLTGGIGLADTTEKVADWIREGDEAFDNFDNLKALMFYERAWALDKKNVELLMKLTWTCNNVGEDVGEKKAEPYFKKAAEYAEKLKELAPKQAKTWFLSAITNGNLALVSGVKKKVVSSGNVARDAKKCIELDPDYGPGYVALGIYYREVASQNRFVRAIADKLLGDLPEGTLEDSEKMLLKGVEEDSESIYAHFQLAKTYEALKKPDKAIIFYKALQKLPVTDHQDPEFKKIARERLRKLK